MQQEGQEISSGQHFEGVILAEIQSIGCTVRQLCIFRGIKDLKKTETDPVTETDLACEEFIKKIVQKEFSDHEFLGEESFEV